MKGVAISGIKGGTGKTTLSHALALGAAWHKVPAYLCHTDNREHITTRNRPYTYYDARDRHDLHSIMERAIVEEGLFLIDGGGNREAFDYWIASSVDLVIIPVTPDPEAVRESLRYAALMRKAGAKEVVYLINQYPSNRFERDFVHTHYISQLPESQVIGKVGQVKSLRVLASEDIGEFKTPNSKVNGFCRSLYKIVTNALPTK